MATSDPPTAPRPLAAPIPDKPHGPRGGWARRLLGPLHVTGVFWYRAHCLAARWLPEWVVRPMAPVMTTLFWLLLIGIRRAVAANLEAVLGPCGFVERQRRIWRTFHDFTWCMTERYEQFAPGKEFAFTFEGLAARDLIHSSRGGFVFFTAHFGNWEVGPLIDFLPEGKKVHVVREPEMNSAAQRLIQDLFERKAKGTFVVHYAGSDLQLGARLLQALRRGDVVALPGDRPRAGMGSQRSTLFGRPMDLPPGPAALARGAGAMMVPVFVFRTGRRRYHVVAREPFAVEQSADKQRDVRHAVDRMAREIEWAIRERPHHWFCWRRLW